MREAFSKSSECEARIAYRFPLPTFPTTLATLQSEKCNSCLDGSLIKLASDALPSLQKAENNANTSLLSIMLESGMVSHSWCILLISATDGDRV